jgi:hypothetical protein
LHDTSDERVFVALYGFTLLAIRFFGYALDRYARFEKLYAPGEVDEELQTERRDVWPVVVAYVTVILIGLAVPTLAVALYLAVAVALVVPFRDIRLLLRDSRR